MGKYKWRLGFLTLAWQPVLEKKSSAFKPVIDLEWDGLCRAIPAQDTKYESSLNDQTKVIGAVSERDSKVIQKYFVEVFRESRL